MKKKLRSLFTTALIAAGIMSVPVTAQAAQKSNINLRANTTYTKYDITSDKKADVIKISQKAPSSQPYAYGKYKVSVIVKNKTALNLSIEGNGSIQYSIYTLSSGRNYLRVKNIIANDHVTWDKLYTYKSGKLVQVRNLMNHAQGAFLARYDCVLKKISGNTMTFLMKTEPGGVGLIQYYVKYTQSGYSLKQPTNMYSVTYNNFNHPYMHGSDCWTAARTLKVYDSQGGTDKVATFYEGYNVFIDYISFSDGECYLLLSSEDSGKYKEGWITCPNTYRIKFFYETLFI